VFCPSCRGGNTRGPLRVHVAADGSAAAVEIEWLLRPENGRPEDRRDLKHRSHFVASRYRQMLLWLALEDGISDRIGQGL
jgi:hypothetical protein